MPSATFPTPNRLVQRLREPRQGEQKTLREDVLEILELRFFSAPYAIKEQIKEINDTTELRRLLRLAVQAESIDAFTQGMQEKC